ncbi:two-component sensor CbrA [Bacterioplanes sanyensis]|uniref:sensor histidine kinase n=1 Tax=Bacterioplanes sanyensis TaxID=1249553 RepID=UPI0016748D03|nr:sensor histidine kinase [Bacterioplanes sanyensis]GGY38777.1 two-component sensor CbrA [Bacterioplanes sanyensis]
MSFSLNQLGLIVFGYLGVLFATAYAVERGWVPRRLVRHPLVYVLSLGVYASAWAFYGSVGLAHQYGYGFLAYYLGIAGAFVMSPILLRPLLNITRIYQLSSLADLLAFRYRSRLAGMLVTVFMLAVVIPMLTLQLRAIADTLHLLNGDWDTAELAFGFCLTMILFAVLFGARHVSPREKHEGLVLALAFESLLKLSAILILAGVALFGVFSEVGGLEQWLVDNQDRLLSEQVTPLVTLQEGPWRTLLLVFFAAAVVMPHMFHMTFTENVNAQALHPASWGFPLFLLAMAMAVPPILWAGVYMQVDTPAEYFAIGIGLKLDSPALVILTFLGGLAAASGIIIVITLAMAAMLLNHLVLPFHKPSPRHDFYRWLLWMRRTLIAAILLLAYGFYYVVGADLDLNRLGLLAFVAAVQFLPGVLGLLYWPKANRHGFLLGLLGGIITWVYGMLLPFSELALGWQVPLLPLPAVDEDNWHLAAMGAMTVNLTLFIVISLLSRQKPSEVSAAEACSIDTVSRPTRKPLMAGNSNDVILSLSKPLGRYVAEREVYQALQDLHLPSYEDRPYALRRLRARLEANLSGLMGPTVAHDIITRSLPFQEDAELSEDIYQIEQRLEGFHDRLSGLAGELDNLRRYHRQTLERLPMGVCSLADDGEILMWNQAMQELTNISAQTVTGSHLKRLPSPWCELLLDFIASPQMHVHKQRIDIGARPRWYSLHKALIQPSGGQPGGMVVLMEDQTDTQLLEEELMHSERLASIGRLAAGVAHEIGNPITGIDSLAQLIRYETDNPELVEMAGQIQEQTQRVSRIVQSLMNFAHAGNQSSEHEAVPICQCVEEAVQLLRLSKRSMDIQFENSCDPELQVLGDAQRLVQVFVNLLGNARDASEAGDCIQVTSEADEHQVILRVVDEGHGIAPDTLDRIFEPFFTTKDVGTGTGLGLALVYSIIEEHYGSISIHSPVRDGRGTCVKVSLPRLQPSEQELDYSA